MARGASGWRGGRLAAGVITARSEDGFGAVQSPWCSGDVEPVADQVAAGSLDDPVAMGRHAARAWS
jgi:hypothetical protein